MTYARIADDQVAEYPVFEGEIRLRHSNVSFPTPFAPPAEYAPVADRAPPAVTYEQNRAEGIPAWEGGEWVRTWAVSPASSDEIAERLDAAWKWVRDERNAKLSDCDWTQLPDAPLTNVTTQQWATYRQALRDITLQADPFGIIWPAEPA